MLIDNFRIKFISFLILLMCTSCVRVWSPDQAPFVEKSRVSDFSPPCAVEFVSAVKQSNITNLSWASRVDLREWTDFVVAQLNQEFTFRQCGATGLAKKVEVKVVDMAAAPGLFTVYSKMNVELFIPATNWRKNYVKGDHSGWSLGRALGSVVYGISNQVLTDREFINIITNSGQK